MPAVASPAIHEPEAPCPIIRVQPYQPGRADARFKQRIKQKRSNHCEQCERSLPGHRLHVHHILLTSIYPQFACEEGNVLILCPDCHSAVSQSEKEGAAFRAYFYSTLPYAVRMRHLPFLETTGCASPSLIAAFRSAKTEHWHEQAFRDWTR